VRRELMGVELLGGDFPCVGDVLDDVREGPPVEFLDCRDRCAEVGWIIHGAGNTE